ncbi:MAG: hypothetical protein AAF570_07945, partial [Bacteroidota bacterium]
PSGPVISGSCANGVQDDDETGVDCGGSCPFGCYTAPPCTPSPNTFELDTIPFLAFSDLDLTQPEYGGGFAAEADNAEGSVFVEIGTGILPDNSVIGVFREIMETGGMGGNGQLEAHEVFLEFDFFNLPDDPTFVARAGEAYIEITATTVTIRACDVEFSAQGTAPNAIGSASLSFRRN